VGCSFSPSLWRIARATDDADFERHVDYIHYNPIKHGLVPRVTDWPYSSFHRYVARGVLPEDWGGDAMNATGQFGE
jgi:putative transposase